MKGKKIGYRTTYIHDGAIHKIGEQNFLSHELATKNGCSSPGYKNLNLIQTPGQRNWCSSAHAKNWKTVPYVDNHLNYGKGWSSVNMVHAGENWQDLASYNQGKYQNYQMEDSCFTQTV